MAKFMALLLLVLAGCSTAPQAARVPSPCDASEVSYDCQVERYNKVNTD